MKCIVIYFSQTGNTEAVAKQIQAGIKEVAGNCDILPIKEASPYRLGGYDLIGIGSPVMGIEPTNVSNFINSMKYVGGKHSFIFCTHGDTPESYAISVYNKMKKRGLKVIGWADWYAESYYSCWPYPSPTYGHLDAIDLKEAKAYGKEIAEKSQRIYDGETDLIPKDPPKSLPLYPFPHVDGWKDYTSLGEAFRDQLKFDKSKCKYPKCTLCQDNCPMYGIDLTMDPPVLARPCIGCDFCAKICPTGAINSMGNGDWINALNSVSWDAAFMKPLVVAEAEGRFRRLIPEDKVGETTPVYQLLKDVHPQWIIGKGPQGLPRPKFDMSKATKKKKK